jgi:rod shape-determining protein MreC
MRRLFFVWGTAGIIGLAAILVLNVPILNSAVKNAAYWALNPIQKNFWVAGAGVHNFFSPLMQANLLAAENEQLRGRVNDLLAQTAAIGDLKKENESLRQGLNLEMEKDFDLKLADIVGKNTARDILIVDKGAKDTVRTGMPVITGQKTLVGRVSKVYDNFSEVTLATNKDFSFDVKIGDDAADGLVKGQGSYRATIDLVPKDKKIEAGQSIITSALGGIFPQGLLVGTISEVYKNDVETFQSAQIELAFNVAGARQVFIAIGKYPLGTETCTMQIMQNER